METLAEPKKDIQNYGMQKLWLCNAYELDIRAKDLDPEKTLKRVINFYEKDKLKIEISVGGNFITGKSIDDIGTHISYPKLIFNIGNEQYGCNININPSIRQTDHQYMDKIWVNIESMLQQPIGNLREFFNRVKSYAEKIEETVKTSYFSAIGGYGFKQVYQITIRDVGMEVEKGSKLDELMKAERDQDMRDILNDADVQAVLRDLLSAHKNKVVTSLRDELPDSGICWRITESQCGSRLLSGLEVKEDCGSIISLANFSDYERLNDMRLVTILRIVNSI